MMIEVVIIPVEGKAITGCRAQIATAHRCNRIHNPNIGMFFRNLCEGLIDKRIALAVRFQFCPATIEMAAYTICGCDARCCRCAGKVAAAF